MKRRSFLRRAAASLSAGFFSMSGVRAGEASPVGSAHAGVTPGCQPDLPFRAMLVGYPHIKETPGGGAGRAGGFFDRDHWNRKLTQWSREGFNVAVWIGPSEVLTGDHFLIRFKEFPEARELTAEENEKTIAQMKWLFQRARALGMKNFLYATVIHYTEAFEKAHGLEKPMPVSPTVHYFHNHGYGLLNPRTNLGVRNDLTRAYVEAAFAEVCQTYEDLEGFYGPMGEAVPGNRGTYFKEAVVPGLKRSGRKPLFIAHQWQTPLEDYLENIAPKEIYENTWLGFHAYNSEQITDAKPYACLVEWAETTGLPTVAAVYPANALWFPFNSPKLAYQITTEMRKIANFQGFVYWEHSADRLSPLFRKALARYAKSNEPYSDEPWLALLQEQFGDRQAAEHFLKAYDVSGRIQPEYCALVWCPNDVLRRELRLPYSFLTGYSYPFSWLTDRVRGRPLQAVWHYAYWAAKDPKTYRDHNGSEWRISRGTRHDFRQESIWGTVGGSEYDIIPPVHMKKVRQMGETCLAEAEQALRTVRNNQEEAMRVSPFMKGYQLLTDYYERKVAAATSALIYSHSRKAEDKADAEKLADETVQAYVKAATFLHEKLDPVLLEVKGSTMFQVEFPGREKKDLPGLIEEEKEERKKLAEIFNWARA